MAELNARIIPKASGTAGEVPLASDLETAELAVNTADGTLFTKDTAGAVVTISGGGGGGAVDSVNGQTGVVELDIQDLLTTNPTPGGLLQYNGDTSQWENVAYLEVPETVALANAALGTQPMIGPSTDYADAAAMTADGWTILAGFNGADDAVAQFSAPAAWRTAATGVQFLDQTAAYNGTGQFFANTNGAVGWDNANASTSGRSGTATTDGANIDCYVCHKSADMKGKLGGYQETVDGNGIRYLTVRLSYFFPYSSGTEYFSTETTFSSDGNVTVKYGTPTNNNIIPNDSVNSTSHGLVNRGDWFLLNGPVGLPGFPGLTPAGDYVAYTYTSTTDKVVRIRVEDLADTPIGTPTNGSTISYNSTTAKWEYVTGGGGGAVASVNGETGAVSLGIEDMDDFEYNQTAGTLVLSDAISGVPSSASEWDAYVITGGTQLYYSNLQTEFNSILSIGTELSLQVPGMASPVTVTLTSNPTVANAQSNYIDVTPAVPSAIQTAANGTALTITASGLPGTDIPLAQGDILQWDNTDSKFKPATITNAVSSVNGETGAVSLGIEDMDDFALNTGTPTVVGIYEYDVFAGGSCAQNDPSLVYAQNKSTLGKTPISVETGLSVSNFGQVAKDWAGFEFSIVGATGPWTSTGEVVVTYNLYGCEGASFEYDIDTIISGSSTVWVRELGQSNAGAAIPLAEGNTLKWNNSDQKFNPSTGVESVNGETGVIDLEIQDMDDFQLVGPAGVTIYRYDNFTGTSSGSMSADGDWSVFQASAITLYFRKVDSDGNQPGNDALFPSSTGGQGTFVDLYASHDQITWFRVNNSAVFNDPTYWSMNTDATSQAALVQSGTLYLSFQDPTVTPLVEGDTLRWNNTDSKFEPAEMFSIKAASYSDPVGGQSLDSQTATVITGITNVVLEHPIYSNSAGVVTVSEAGVYELYGCVGANGDTANYRWTTEFDVRVDGTMVARQVGGYIRASNDSNFSDISITTIVALTAGQEIDFTLKRVSNITGNAVTLAHTSRILIKKLS